MVDQKQDLPELNVELLRECINFAKSNGDDDQVTWYQRAWAISKDFTALNAASSVHECKTAFCIAGYAAHVTGNTAILEVEEEGCGSGCCPAHTHKEIGVINPDKIMGPTWDGPLESHHEFGNAGRALLGLTLREGNMLFQAENTLNDVITIANRIMVSRGYDPEF